MRVAGLIPSILDSSRPVENIILHPKDAEALGIDVDAIFAPWGSNAGELAEIPGDADQLTADILALTDLDQQLDAMIADLDRRQAAGLMGGASGLEGIVSSSTDPAATSSQTPALTADALADLKAKYARRQLRMIVGCPLFPADRAFEWERRGVMFLGDDVLEALRFDAALAGRGPQVRPFTLFGVKLEPWGSVDDHQTLAVELARELDPS